MSSTSQSLTQSEPCWNLTYVIFGWRKYLLNTGAHVDGLVFDVKVNLDTDINFDVDFDVIEVLWDFEDDIVSLVCIFANRQKWVTFKFSNTERFTKNFRFSRISIATCKKFVDLLRNQFDATDLPNS